MHTPIVKAARNVVAIAALAVCQPILAHDIAAAQSHTVAATVNPTPALETPHKQEPPHDLVHSDHNQRCDNYRYHRKHGSKRHSPTAQIYGTYNSGHRYRTIHSEESRYVYGTHLGINIYRSQDPSYHQAGYYSSPRWSRPAPYGHRHIDSTRLRHGDAARLRHRGQHYYHGRGADKKLRSVRLNPKLEH